MIYPRSVVEVAGIGVDAAKECYYDTCEWLGKQIAKIDEWLCDYGDSE